ncbi:hypothetical protein ANN_10605 [Periplaneta americana]|uniref:Ricin B lectin domain-containing protein n=1 Tax=Periplaneta americana TaxID=6978 RepID=A0ABQ8TPG1_PERAM|nr:hypothetical protein ANN_10605 [Periplaneta americana]
MAFYIQNVGSGKYLDVKDNNKGDGAEVILFEFKGEENQQWKYKKGMIQSKLNGKALDIKGGSDLGQIVMWKANGGDNQKWFFDDDFTIRSGMGTVLDVTNGNTDNYATLQSHPKHGGANQKFRVVPVNDD